MRLHALVFVTAGCLLAAGSPRIDEKVDREALQGTWTLVEGEANGDKIPEDAIKELSVIIKDDHYTLKRGDDNVQEGTFKLDASKKPATIDVSPEGDAAGETVKGIYALEENGKTFKVCVTGPNGDRPTEFKTTADSMSVLYVMKKK